MLQEHHSRITIFLAEDDEDDSLLFMEAVRELNSEITVKVSRDGQQLLEDLHKS